MATTRPETMLGDTAVAVNPQDKRYKNLIGKTVILPLMNREMPIIADELVDSSFGTGAVKVTPAHDPVDFEIAQRHQLPEVKVIDGKGRMTGLTDKYAGLDRSQCREEVVKDLQTLGLLEKVEEYSHRIGHCYRCGTVIEPLISEQWFLSTKEMARKAMKVVEEGKIKFFPERWVGPYLQWLENLRDWCISRQIWWGHQIPVWYCTHCLSNKIEVIFKKEILINGIPNIGGTYLVLLRAGLSDKEIIGNMEDFIAHDIDTSNDGVICSIEKPVKCTCGNTYFLQDPNVLDTWFSSALWPFSVFGWSGKTFNELEYYYPTSALVTGYEILYLWVARMVMMGIELVGDIPFENVYIHGIVRDVSGRKMSKSLGNVIDPLDIMKTCGTDALRFALLYSGVTGQDLCLSEESFLMARNFANKIWNASRFVLMNLEGFTTSYSPLTTPRLDLADRWIISEYNSLVKSVTKNLGNYQLSEVVGDIYEFFWHKFCDWYVELIKPKLSQTTTRADVQAILVYILEGTIKLLHPFMPFITEEIWQSLRQFRVQSLGFKKETGELSTTNSQLSASIMVSPWPEYDEMMIDKKASEEMQLLMDVVSAIRNLRSETRIPPQEKINLVFKIDSSEKEKLIQTNLFSILLLTNSEKLEFGMPQSKDCVLTIVDGIEIYIPLTAIDREKEIKRLEKEIENLSSQINKIDQKMSDQNFLNKAPEEEIKKVKQRLKETKEKKNKLEQTLLCLKGG
ncbi:MAG TPA: valine--tRNA ligase [Elusimicrobia bacterium]|nr:valine--tRNA ligase [Elusimicrobiota bacterium]